MSEQQDRPWNAGEQAYARDLLKLGYSLSEIASYVGRTVRQVAILLRDEIKAIEARR